MTKIIGVVLAALAFALLLTAGPAVAQECEPKTWRNSVAPGSERVEVWELDGRMEAWWCPLDAPIGAPAGTKVFARNFAGGLYVHGWDAARVAAPRVLAASSPWAQFRIERDAVAATVRPTPAQACRVREIRHAACVALQLARLPGYPGAATRAEALADGKCGPVPVCAAPPAWLVDVGTDAAKTTRPAFALVSGVRATTSTGRAMSGQPCKPEVAAVPSLTAGTVWAAFGPSYSPGMVALCRKVP